jgi:hypothetical protein
VLLNNYGRWVYLYACFIKKTGLIFLMKPVAIWYPSLAVVFVTVQKAAVPCVEMLQSPPKPYMQLTMPKTIFQSPAVTGFSERPLKNSTVSRFKRETIKIIKNK